MDFIPISALAALDNGSINQAAIKGEPGTGFETRFVKGVDNGPFECGNCEYFKNGNACRQADMMQKSKRPRHADGSVVVDAQDCCEYIERMGTNWKDKSHGDE